VTVPVVAYCLGATLALLREASWPSHGSGDPIAAVAPVVDTTADRAAGRGMGVVLAHPWLHPTLALDDRGFVPGPLIREAFHWLRPKALRTVRTWRLARSTPELAAGYAAMATWVWDHRALPGGVLFDAVALFRAGGLPGRVDLARISVPVLVLCAARDHIVPPASSRALDGAVGGPVEVVEVDAGHVGMLVSLGSGDVLRPALLSWLDRLPSSKPAPPEPAWWPEVDDEFRVLDA
jgi:polyhydroxyalkanoate synthase